MVKYAIYIALYSQFSMNALPQYNLGSILKCLICDIGYTAWSESYLHHFRKQRELDP